MSTMIVEPIPEYPPHLVMRWGEQPDDNDVLAAFDAIAHHIQQAQEPICVVVDVTTKPSYNIRLTFTEALYIQKLPHPPCWLVVGHDRMSQYIAQLLKVVGRAHIEWFNSYEEALDFIATQYNMAG